MTELPLRVSWDLEIGGAPMASASLADVLTPHERAHHDRFAFEKRRRDWLMGRFVAKRLIARMVRERFGRHPLASAVQIDTAPTGAPVPLNASVCGLIEFPAGARLPLELSISHSRGAAFAAAFWHADEGSGRARIGADLEWIEPRAPDLFDDYFTTDERRYCAQGGAGERDRRATIVWSAKESGLKAAGLGLTVDTRAIVCLPASSAIPLLPEPHERWQALSIATQPPLSLSMNDAVGCWQIRDGFAFTLVVARTSAG